MTPELKAKWVTALRSGDYTQGLLSLRTDNNHCCLGVLCDVLSKEATPRVIWNGDCAVYSNDPNEVIYMSGIPEQALNEIGMTYNEQQSLWVMNDRLKKSFAEIADWIEVNL